MKKAIAFTSMIFILAAVIFSGCKSNDTDNSSSASASEAEDTTAQSVENTVKETDLSVLYDCDVEGGNEFAGFWKITDGEGSDLSSFVYRFDGDDSANMIVGSVGYCAEYAAEDGRFICQLAFGINGAYQYTAEENRIVLINEDTNDETVLERIENYSIVPESEENPKIDEELLGAWLSENGEYYYFDKNGIMYNNQYQTMFTFYNYNAEDGKIKASYVMQDSIDDEYEYSIDGDTLTIDDYEYERISADELV